LRVAELLAVALLLLAALVPRARDLNGPWDRELEGFQGACFVIGAVNFSRIGVGAYGGYPTLSVDLPGDSEALPYLYPNHPPTVPIAIWSSLKLFAPEGWDQAWQQGEAPPRGTERAARVPFLIGHLLGLLALWWVVRLVADARVALLALALAAALPIQILYGALVNYENFVWPLMLLGVGFQLRYLKTERTRELLIAGFSFLAAACVTFTPAFLVPSMAFAALWFRGLRCALKTGAVLSVAALVPPVLHGLWTRQVLPPELAGNLSSRLGSMLHPLFDGEHPLGEWLRRQLVRMEHFFTLPILILAAIGLVLALWRAWEGRVWAGRGSREVRGLSAGPLLLGSGCLFLMTFYRHTWDGDAARNGQTVFLLNLAPGIAILAAEALGALGRPLLRLRGGEGPLILVTLAFLLPGLVRAEHIRQDWRDPGPLDDPSLESGPMSPLPSTAGQQIAAILPPGAVGIYPQGMALTPACSYYAWRTVIPATKSTYDLALLRIKDAFGLGDAPRYILIPKNPPPPAVETVAETRALVAALFERIAQTDEWELWPAFPASPAPTEDDED
jgi:hypothetical protein